MLGTPPRQTQSCSRFLLILNGSLRKVCSTLTAITRNRPLYPAREEPRTGRAWTTQPNPRTLFPHRSSRLDGDNPPAHSTWASSTRIPSALSTSEAETRLGRRRMPEFAREGFEGEPRLLARWPVDAEASGMWNDRSAQRHDQGWLPDRDRTRERDEELRHRALARINESASLLRLPPSSPPPASYWYGGHHDTAYMSPTTQTMVGSLLEGTPDPPRVDGPSSLSSILQSERRARRLPERYASGSVHSSRDWELREREGQSTSPSVLPPFTDFRTRSGLTPDMGQDINTPYFRMLRSDHSSRPTIFRPPSPHLAPSRASPPLPPPLSTAGRAEATSAVGPSPRSPNPADSASIFRNFDLSTYTGGPFRASLSTFNRRRERGEMRTQRYWDQDLDRERDREIERELDLERELDRERGRQRERQMGLVREGSMLQSMLSRGRSTGTQARAEDPEILAAIPLPDPDLMFRRTVSSPLLQLLRVGALTRLFFRWNHPRDQHLAVLIAPLIQISHFPHLKVLVCLLQPRLAWSIGTPSRGMNLPSS